MYLLFAPGKRPTRAAINSFVENQAATSIAHDPLALDAPEQDPNHSASHWVELLRDGLTFDLDGLLPGDACAFPVPQHLFDLGQNSDPRQLEALKLLPGSHLAGAATVMPVARGMMALARDLVRHFVDAEAVIWPPSESAIGRQFFESSITAWLEGGPFPALGLIAYREVEGGSLQTVGLDYWIGQELRLEASLTADKVHATRLGVRIVNQLVLIGKLEQSERVIGPDGAHLLLRPSTDRKLVHVSSG